MKKDIKNIEASICDRLKNKSKESNCSFSEILQYYAIERFLYRFSQSGYADKFILKGALMFMVWQVPGRRTTLDIDLLARYDNRITAIEKVIDDVCNIKVIPDGLIFDPSTIKGQRIKEAADYEGIRVKFRGFLGRTRITMQVDIGFGDSVYPRPSAIDYPVILDFPKPHLRGYPVESVISEKFEAMVKFGLLNSRMKDFYDILLMMRQYNFNGAELVEALKRTFKIRKTSLPAHKPLFAEEIYNEKSDRQALWRTFLRKRDIENVPENLGTTARAIEDFLINPINAIHMGRAFNKRWDTSGLWR
jgi:hypothetical protein